MDLFPRYLVLFWLNLEEFNWYEYLGSEDICEDTWAP